MPAKPHVTIADDNQTPTTAEQQTDTNWAQPVSVRDGHNATLGAKADTAVTDPTLSATEIALLKGLLTILKGTLAVGGTVNVGNFPTTQTVAGAVTANIGTTGALALDGTDATGVTMPAGGVGIKGWLSGIYSRLLAVLSVKSVDGTGVELFTVANPGQVKLQSSGATGATAPTQAVEMGGKTPGGTLEALSLDANKNQKVAPTNSVGNPIENTEGLLLASGPRTTTTFSPVQTNYNAKGVMVALKVTGNPATADTVRPIIRARDTAGNDYAVSTGLTHAANGRWLVVCYPGANAAVNGDVDVFTASPLPRSWLLQVLHSGTGSFTYEAYYSYII